MKKIDCLILQAILSNNCNSPNGAAPDENTPGWHIYPFVLESTKVYEVQLDGETIPICKLSNPIPEVFFNIERCAAIGEVLTADGSAIAGIECFKFDVSDDTFYADGETKFVHLSNADMMIALISFEDKEGEVEFGIEQGVYVHYGLIANNFAIAYRVPNE